MPMQTTPRMEDVERLFGITDVVLDKTRRITIIPGLGTRVMGTEPYP